MDQQQAQFEAMLVTLMSTDNESRKAAEAEYEAAKSRDPVWLLQALTEVAAVSPNQDSQYMASVLLRKVVADKNEYFLMCSAAVQESLKQRLLEIFGNTQHNNVRRGMAQCISALAVKLSVKDRNAWNDLWPLLFDTVGDNAANADIRGACCEIFAGVALCLATGYLKNHIADLAKALQTCIQDENSTVVVKAFEAVNAFAIAVTEDDLQHLKLLTSPMLDALTKFLNKSDWDTAQDMLQVIVVLAEKAPLLLRPQLTNILQGMMNIASVPTVDADTRHLAVEVMVTLCESSSKFVKKVPHFSKSLFELLFQYVMNPELEDDWETEPERVADENESSTDFDIGASGLDRISMSLKGKQIQSVAQKLIMENINKPEWQARYGALTCLTYIIEGCKKEFASHLGEIMTIVTNLCKDENMVVRYGALSAMSQFSQDFDGKFQHQFHQQACEIMCTMFKDPVMKIQALAAGAMNAFIDPIAEKNEEAAKKLLAPYVHDLALAAVTCVNTVEVTWVRHECLVALSALTEASGEHMAPYVQDLVPVYQRILQQQPTNRDETNMLCRALECTTLLASAAGYEKFADYAEDVCKLLSTMMNSGVTPEDPRMRFILRGWTNMIECLDERILPQLPDVIGLIISVADLDCDIDVQTVETGEVEDDDIDAFNNDKDNRERGVAIVRIKFAGVGERALKINTGLIEDKTLALDILLTICDHLKGKLMPYLNDIVNVSVKCLTFRAQPEVRESGSQILALCGAAFKDAKEDHKAAELLTYVTGPLLASIKDEMDRTCVGELMTSYGKLLKAAPKDSLTQEHLSLTVEILQEVMKDSVKRKEDLANARGELDEDDEDEQEALEEEDIDEEFLLSETVDLIEALLETTSPFTQIFIADFFPIVHVLLGDKMSPAEKCFGVSMLDSFVEFTPQAATNHLSDIASTFLTYSTSTHPELLQSSVYGCGLIARLVGEQFPNPPKETVKFVEAASQNIMTFLQSEEAQKNEDYADTVCNAISTNLKFLQYFARSGAIDVKLTWEAVLHYMPLENEDYLESGRIHKTLLEWIEQDNSAVTDIPGLSEKLMIVMRKTDECYFDEDIYKRLHGQN